MGLLNIYQQKTVSILPGSSVTVEYLRTSFHNIMEGLPEGEITLVKRHIQPSEANAILRSGKSCVAATSEPDTIEKLDACDVLEDAGIPVGVRDGIVLDYLHCGDELYVFSDELDVPCEFGHQPPIPNALRIYPISRHEVEIIVSIDFDSIFRGRNGEPVQLVSSETENEGDPQAANNAEMTAEETKARKEVDLLRKKIKKTFDERFSVVKAVLNGIALESHTIPLTEFYQKNGIASQRLRGSWMLFSKEQAAEMMDVGIGQWALKLCRDAYTQPIEGYGRIVQKTREAKYFDALREIETDMKAYLTAGQTTNTVGTLKVRKQFNPAKFVGENLDQLRQYLYSLSPGGGVSFAQYQVRIEKFIEKAAQQMLDFSSKVKLQITIAEFGERQWEDGQFLLKVEDACKENPEFFGEPFCWWMIRYLEAMNELTKWKETP